jgi:hypothetical protein
MPDPYAQLQRCTNQELLDEVTGFLDLAQIPYRLQSTAGVSSTAWMGFKDQGSVAVMVPGEMSNLISCSALINQSR